eukprot:gene25453-31917_t
MPRPIQATIHTTALRYNLARARQAAPDAQAWAVVKANAYGHGIERAFEGLRGADGFALLDLVEAERVRALGWRGPILLLEGAFEARDLELCSRLHLWHTVHCDEQIDMLALHKTHEPHRVFLKMNSGMNRLGFAPQRYRSAWTRLNALPQVDEISLMTHFSDADGPKGIAEQMARFEEATRDLPGERSVSNSAATLRHAQFGGLLVGGFLTGDLGAGQVAARLPVAQLQRRHGRFEAARVGQRKVTHLVAGHRFGSLLLWRHGGGQGRGHGGIGLRGRYHHQLVGVLLILQARRFALVAAEMAEIALPVGVQHAVHSK